MNIRLIRGREKEREQTGNELIVYTRSAIKESRIDVAIFHHHRHRLNNFQMATTATTSTPLCTDFHRPIFFASFCCLMLYAEIRTEQRKIISILLCVLFDGVGVYGRQTTWKWMWDHAWVNKMKLFTKSFALIEWHLHGTNKIQPNNATLNLLLCGDGDASSPLFLSTNATNRQTYGNICRALRRSWSRRRFEVGKKNVRWRRWWWGCWCRWDKQDNILGRKILLLCPRHVCSLDLFQTFWLS